ncbi:hypothetical protein UCDDA912_g02318 [Diaporthe ampelina]|uniref:Uncharacterized protein n=1 Tax=Diaporthe ampelina TaxID=1214573 RepID=A0A0G2FUM1_9PEZI|nr:hypothetical protein UCDDA912_g02318 [Diaporthe ampelina]
MNKSCAATRRPKPDGREDILKEDCQELIDFMKTRPGYRIGNLDVVAIAEAAMRTTRDPTCTRMVTVSGSVTCAGDCTPLVA